MSDLRRENENLRRVLDVARYMAVTNDLDVLLGTIVEAACDVLNCERGTIFLYDAATDELYSRVAKDVEAFRFPAERGIAGAAAKQRTFINVPDAYSDSRFNPEVDRKTGFRTRNLLTFPLENLRGDLIGVLQALNKHAAPFDAEDEDLARVLSAQAGVALERGRLLEEYAEKQRMQHDLEVARQIQQGLLPKKNPKLPGYDIAGWNRSADETGGDCFDFMPLPDGRLGVFLADATGHGIGAALVIAQARSLLRAMLSVTQDLRTIVTGVNDLISKDLADDRFVTAFIGVVDPRTHTVEYISNGQGPLVMLSDSGVDSRGANSFPLAVMPGFAFEKTDSFELAPGATLVLLTDGFYETTNPASEQFGEARVVEYVRRCVGKSAVDLISGLHDEIRRFASGEKQADDLTAVVIHRTS